MNRLSTWIGLAWAARSPSERRLIATAALIIVGGALYQFVYEPAATGTVQLQRSLPQTQAQAIQAVQLSQQLKAQGAMAPALDFSSKSAIEMSLQSSEIEAVISDTLPYTLTFTAQSGDALWLWLRTAPIQQARFKHAPDGSWSGSITLNP